MVMRAGARVRARTYQGPRERGMPRLSGVTQPADGALEGGGQRAVQLRVGACRVGADEGLVRLHEHVQLQFRRCRLPAISGKTCRMSQHFTLRGAVSPLPDVPDVPQLQHVIWLLPLSLDAHLAVSSMLCASSKMRTAPLTSIVIAARMTGSTR